MSESFLIAGILSVSGGLQDAYTYMYRGKVFANAQTGNIVLLAQNLVDRFASHCIGARSALPIKIERFLFAWQMNPDGSSLSMMGLHRTANGRHQFGKKDGILGTFTI